MKTKKTPDIPQIWLDLSDNLYSFLTYLISCEGLGQFGSAEGYVEFCEMVGTEISELEIDEIDNYCTDQKIPLLPPQGEEQ